MVLSQLTANSASQIKQFSCLSLQIAKITGVDHHALLIFFVFLVEMGFHHVEQAGLELPISGDPRPPKVLGLQA